jgi:two-component system chemotaxis response regulator CheB
MAKKDIVVIGASAGGMEALQKLVARLPANLPASIFIVWHLSPGARTILPSVLSKAGPLLAAQPEDGDGIEPGRSRKATSA